MSSSPSHFLLAWDALTLGKATAGAFAIATLVYVRSQRRSSLPFPPGPPAKFLLGNLLDMSPKAPWLKWTEWAQSYGGELTVSDRWLPLTTVSILIR